MNIKKRAKNIHLHFSQLSGSEYIASEHAIRGLMKWLIKRKPKTLLEVGAGIGTLTFASVTTLADQGARERQVGPKIITIENNGFCLSELRKNLAEFWDNFDVIENIAALPDEVSDFDFVILDGGESDPRYFSKLARGATLFVEGLRGPQRELLEAVSGNRRYARAGFLSLSLRRRGGYWVYQFEPSMTDQIRFTLVNLYARAWGSVKYRLKLYLMKNREQTLG